MPCKITRSCLKPNSTQLLKSPFWGLHFRIIHTFRRNLNWITLNFNPNSHISHIIPRFFLWEVVVLCTHKGFTKQCNLELIEVLIYGTKQSIIVCLIAIWAAYPIMPTKCNQQINNSQSFIKEQHVEIPEDWTKNLNHLRLIKLWLQTSLRPLSNQRHYMYLTKGVVANPIDFL